MRFLALILVVVAGCSGGVDDDFVIGSAEFEVVGHKLDGALLRLDVRYSGGCEEHDFRVCWGGILAPSDPPQIPIEVNHYNHGDSCEALITESLYIDLSEIDDVAAGGADVSIVLPVGGIGIRSLYGFFYEPGDDFGTSPEEPLVIYRGLGSLEAKKKDVPIHVQANVKQSQSRNPNRRRNRLLKR